MRRHLTLPNLLRVIGIVQILVLYAWGLYRWRVGTLLISTVYIILWLALNDRETSK